MGRPCNTDVKNGTELLDIVDLKFRRQRSKQNEKKEMWKECQNNRKGLINKLNGDQDWERRQFDSNPVPFQFNIRQFIIGVMKLFHLQQNSLISISIKHFFFLFSVNLILLFFVWFGVSVCVWVTYISYRGPRGNSKHILYHRIMLSI